MAYQYDAFFSYKRDRESDDWHERVKNKLTFWLKQELQRQDVKIFFDTEEIRTGMRWSQKLSDALRRSKCLVCIWSPLYFQSRWCVSEWMSFVERSNLVNNELIIPASYFDGENFPQAAKATQFLDFSEFASTMPRFWDTESAVRFEELRIRPFCARSCRDDPASAPLRRQIPYPRRTGACGSTRRSHRANRRCLRLMQAHGFQALFTPSIHTRVASAARWRSPTSASLWPLKVCECFSLTGTSKRPD
jgi:hypothetical protein